MDLLAGLAAVALVGIYLYSRKSRRPEQGPLAAADTPVAELTPEALRSAVQGHPRPSAKSYSSPLSGGGAVAFGHTPGHDRLAVFAPTADDPDAYAYFDYSLASQKWTTETPPPNEGEIRNIIRDTFPG